MNKKKEKGRVVICNGKHTIRTCSNSLDISNLSQMSPIADFCYK